MSSEVQIIESPTEIITDIGLNLIRDLHESVSNLDTPKSFVKNKMGTDYVEYSYMRSVADKYYPGWSWTIVNTDNLGSEAFMVHGRLKWYEGGIWRLGDMTAAHRIMQKRDGSGFVDVGNDIKSANTDCIKKAFNMYLNIADDVYRNRVEDPSLSKEDIETLTAEMEGLDEEWKVKISSSIENGDVEKRDMSKVISRINQLKEEAINE
jgi:hypothetical protein